MEDVVELYLLSAVHLSAALSYNNTGNEVSLCEIRAVLISPLSPSWGPNHFFVFFFSTSLFFLFVCCLPETVCAGADRVDFSPTSRHFQSRHIPDQLPYIFSWPCNLSLFDPQWFHTGVKRPKKEVNEVEFPFEMWELSFLSFHLI